MTEFKPALSKLLHNAAKFITKCVGAVYYKMRQFVTKCGSLLQNAALLQNEMKKLLHFGRLLQNAPLLQNAAQQGLSIHISYAQLHCSKA